MIHPLPYRWKLYAHSAWAEHLLLGLLRLEDSLAATVLRENGIELEPARQILQRLRAA